MVLIFLFKIIFGNFFIDNLAICSINKKFKVHPFFGGKIMGQVLHLVLWVVGVGTIAMTVVAVVWNWLDPLDPAYKPVFTRRTKIMVPTILLAVVVVALVAYRIIQNLLIAKGL
ncbi:MAG: hypothetical protein C3F02_04860 [Parcubacteria group bacterium]|nr:MAG: hypothetical protein C3F02_04860 [Parcubacteria group bacterium]